MKHTSHATKTGANAGRAQRSLRNDMVQESRNRTALEARVCLRAGNRAAAKLTIHAHKASWTVAFARARRLFAGGARYSLGGKTLSRAQAFHFHAHGKNITIQPTDGTSRPVEWQLIEEMQLAARAAFIGGIDQIPPGWKAANRAAAREYHRATREQVFASREASEHARARAYSDFLSQCDGDGDGQENVIQPGPHEFMIHADADADLNPRMFAARALREKRILIRAYWQSSKSNFAQTGLASDSRLLRELARDIADRDGRAYNEALRRRIFRLWERMRAGAEILAMQDRPALPCEIARCKVSQAD